MTLKTLTRLAPLKKRLRELDRSLAEMQSKLQDFDNTLYEKTSNVRRELDRMPDFPGNHSILESIREVEAALEEVKK